MSFIFGENTPWTYDQIQQKRAQAQRLASSLNQTPRNVGEGLHAIGKALAVRGIEKRASAREKELREQFDEQFAETKGVSGAARSMLDMYSNPMATEGQKKILGALLAKGVPGFSRGGKSRGGMAVVGEAGPELVDLPEGANVKPLNSFVPGAEYQVAQANTANDAEEETFSEEELAQMATSAGIDPEQLKGLGLNSTEAKNFGYLLRMMEAETTIRGLADSNTIGQRMLEMIPGQDIESFFMDPEYRQYMLARDNFNEAALRAATGATINASEMPTQRRNYFPLPNDDDDTRALLQRQRQALMMALAAGSGKGANIIPDFGQPVVPSSPDLSTMSDEELLKALGG